MRGRGRTEISINCISKEVRKDSRSKTSKQKIAGAKFGSCETVLYIEDYIKISCIILNCIREVLIKWENNIYRFSKQTRYHSSNKFVLILLP